MRWGAACAQCAIAKAKCLRPDESPGAKCERKTAQLEERLDSLIRALQGPDGITTPDKNLAIPEALATPKDADLQNQLASSPPGSKFITIPPTYNAFGPQTCICRPAPGRVPASVDSDVTLLAIYQESLTPVYPFVVVPHGTFPADLQSTRPFLMSCIRMVTSLRSLRSMQAQMYQLKAHVSQHVLLCAERSLDLLAGLVVMLGWHHRHCMVHAQLQQLVSIATTLAAELGLTRSPGWQERTKLLVSDLGEVRERTNEERRLLLGVWYLSSTVSTGLQQVEPMSFSPYMQRCLRELETAREYESDTYLVYLIKLQNLSDKIVQQSRRSDDEDEDESERKQRAPFAAYIPAFEAGLNNLIRDIPATFQTNKLIRIHINTIRLRLHEPPKLDAALLSSLSKSTSTTGMPLPLDSLYRANAALRTWYDEWLGIPIPVYPYMPMAVSMDAVYAVTILGRWAKISIASTVRHRQVPVDSPLPPDPSGNYNNPSPQTSAPTPASSAPTTTPASSSSTPSPDDAKLAQAVAALKVQLETQPALALDVMSIMDRLCNAMEQASAWVAQRSEDPAGLEHDFWSLSAAKMKIAQLKLEHWAAMVAEEAESDGDEEYLDGGGGFTGVVEGLGFPGYEGWTGDTTTAGVFDTFGSLSWMEGVEDWGGMMGRNGPYQS
ncbi:arsenate reductase [Colletotrichum truncatum]|uniref:Arsenate reductase n=1 Tax=Colletotrichum truncatum TaxID=5467 RepID=A0ACC3YSY2_COLTU